jgi:ABC-type transport system involved in multi-copper enzyme maturation permease subunit
MLWYKSWRELRAVILVGITAMAIACVLIVMNQQAMRDHADAPMTYVAYIWKSVYNSVGRDLFVVLSIVLGSGGLLQERARGTSGFTLALPVRKKNIVFTRAAIGYCGVLAMAIVPVIVVPAVSRYIGQYYPVGQAARFAVLWAAGGALFYAFTFTLSHYCEGEHISVLLAIPSLMLYGVLLQLPWLVRFRMLDVFDVINGEDMPFFDETRHLLRDPLPWVTLVVMMAAAIAFVTFASRRIEPRDF